MPTEAPTMAASASGLSMTRWLPNVRCRSSVTRTTPPSTPTSSPMITTSASRCISCMRARLRALTMFSLAMALPRGSSPGQSLTAHGCRRPVRVGLRGRRLLTLRHLLALKDQMRRQLRVGVVKHHQRVGSRHVLEAPHGCRDLRVDGRLQAVFEEIALLQIGAEAAERVLALPRPDFLLRPVLGGIVRCRMHGEPVSHAFDECGPGPGPGP